MCFKDTGLMLWPVSSSDPNPTENLQKGIKKFTLVDIDLAPKMSTVYDAAESFAYKKNTTPYKING